MFHCNIFPPAFFFF